MSQTPKMGDLVRNAQNGHLSGWTATETAEIWPSEKALQGQQKRRGTMMENLVSPIGDLGPQPVGHRPAGQYGKHLPCTREAHPRFATAMTFPLGSTPR
jgi:hypothetical protein